MNLRNIFLFLGIALMLMFSSYNYTVLSDIKGLLVLTTAGAKMPLVYLKKVLLPATVIIGLLLIALSWGGKMARAFKVYYPVNILILSSFAWLFYVDSPLIHSPQVIGGFYLWANLSMLLSPMLVWGFANQEVSFKSAVLLYPILGVFVVNLALIASGSIIVLFSSGDSQYYSLQLGTVAALNLLIFAVYMGISRFNRSVEDKPLPVKWGYWIALAALVFAVKLALFFPEIAFKDQLKQVFPDLHSYSNFMANWSMTKWMLGVFAGFVSIIFGIILYFRGITILTKLIGFIGLGMFITGGSYFYLTQTLPLSQETVLTSTLGYTLLVSLMGMLNPLKELAYFGVDRRNRFALKIAADLIIFSLASSAGTFIATGALFFGPLNALTSLFAALFVIAMLVVFAGLYRINRDLKQILVEKTP